MLTIDYTNALSDVAGPEGIPPDLFAEAQDVHADLPQTVASEKATGRHAYLSLPADARAADEVAAFADHHVKGRFENFLLLGIGGSALGAQALFCALSHPFHNILGPEARLGAPRFFVADNVDPELVAGILDVCDPAETLVNVVSKSGGTTETQAQMLVILDLLRDRLGPEGLREHVVFTTDPARGLLRAIGKDLRLHIFDVPPGVGGRFSVFTPVGLLPAAALGVDVHDLLVGAQIAYSRLAGAAADDPAFVHALLGHLFAERVHTQKRMAVFMPYSSALRGVADWYRQLLAESLGKKLDLDGNDRPVGPTPIPAIGTTDQHSQVQLYVEGPRDKWITFVEVERFRHDLDLPPFQGQAPEIAYLSGRRMSEVLHASKRGTELALTDAGCPNATFRLPGLDAQQVGELLGTLMLATTYGGALYRVNPYDQPGVEAQKLHTFAHLGKPGFEAQQSAMKARLSATTRRLAGP